MDNSNEFDELARRKLAERSFAFDEGHWQAAQAALGTGRGRNRGAWYLAALVLLLLGGGTWWWAQDGTTIKDPAEHTAEVQRSAPERNQLEQQGSNGTVETSSTTSERNAAEASQADSELSGTPQPEESPRSLPAQEPAPSVPAPAVVASSQNGSSADGLEVPPTQELRTKPLAAPKHDPTLPDVVLELADGEVDAGTEADAPKEESKTVAASVPDLGVQADPERDVPSAPTMVDRMDGNTAAAQNDSAVSEEEVAQAEGSTANVAPSSTDPSEARQTIGDTLSSETTVEQAKDTADVSVPEALQLPLVAQGQAWELGVSAGIFSTTSQFQGANSGDWSNTVSRQQGMSFGAELLHMGRNFGVGSGIHYSTYAEGIAVDAVSDTRTDVLRFWFLQPVDTMILFITDTMDQGGTPYYVGEPVNTTVNVLTQGFDTTTTTEQRRTARELYNRVSYVEIPLLLDAHLVQGRWSIGMRGGPTLGLLAGRRGALPNSSNDGYTEFSDQAFRELMIGYTARAYIRYRWNAAWSIGLEPAIRGQLMNSLDAGPLDRRSSAFGGMLSLSYRLR